MKRNILIAWLVLSLCCVAGFVYAADTKDAEIQALKQKVEELEKRIADLEKIVMQKSGNPSSAQNPAVAEMQKKARARMIKDQSKYTRTQLQEIEQLYQSANKNLDKPEAKDSLQKLVTTYKDANRTGCAVLYLGQISKGDDQIKYLQQAINDFSDCWYGNGVQVGAYARFYLGQVYQEAGKKEEAKKLFDQIRTSYPDAIDHRGNKLIDGIPK